MVRERSDARPAQAHVDPGPMARLGRAVVYRRWLVLGLALAFVVASAVLGAGVEERLSAGGFFDGSSESAEADRVLEEQFGSSAPNVVFLVSPVDGFLNTPANREAGLALTERLRAEPTLRSVESYWTVEVASPLVLHPLGNRHGTSGLIVATIIGDENDAVVAVGDLAARYSGTIDGFEVAVGGPAEVSRQVREQARSDLASAELTMAPFALTALLVVFAGVIAAFLPLVVAVVAVVGTFLVLTVVSGQTEVSIFARVLTTALGVGLGIDYSLFVISRFREELTGGQSVAGAVHRTVDTAGRTVLVSAGTVAVSLSALFIFPIAYLRSFAFAGVAVVILAAVTAVIVLPALLAVLGGRINAISVRRPKAADGTGFWYRQAGRVIRRPLPVALVVVAVLAMAGLPFLGVRTSRVDDRVLPDAASSRSVSDTLRAEFSASELAPLTIVVPSYDGAGDDPTALHDYALSLAMLDGVERVVSEDGAYFFHPLAEAVIGPSPVSTASDLSGPTGTRLTVLLSGEPISPEGESVVRAIRSTPTAGLGSVLVTGESARLVDTKAAVFDRLPIGLAAIAAATFLLLWVLADSVLVPIKALVLNMLSLSATFGALVWVFQDGHLAGLLGFTATGTIDVFTPIIMFCVAFGLSMDYEVFVLSRIKEVYDGTGDNTLAVARGLEQTGGIVTAAALLLAMVFGAFVLSDVSVVKMLGFGLALAVLVDAFLVRATLMPAFMIVAGRANWWSPESLHRAHRRLVG